MRVPTMLGLALTFLIRVSSNPINTTSPSLAPRDYPYGNNPLGGHKWGAINAPFPNNMSQSPCFGTLYQMQEGFNKWLLCQDTYIQKYEDYVGMGKVLIRPAGKIPNVYDCAAWCVSEGLNILTSVSWHGKYGWECACYTGAPRTTFTRGSYFAYYIGTVNENNGRWRGSELLELPDGHGEEYPEDENDWKAAGYKWPQIGRPGGEGWPGGNNWGLDPNY